MDARAKSRKRCVLGGARVLWVLLSLGLTAGAGCGDPEAAEPSRVASLALPLTVISGGITYRLRGTFLVRASPSPDAPVVRTLRSDDAPGETVLRADLPPGSYYVFLAPGWQLVREAAGGPVPLHAALTTDNPLSAALDEGRDAQLTFHFSVDGAPLRGDGELRVDIAIERDVCGDGTRGATEACDDGSQTGRPDKCDASCRFLCRGACPVRVDPGASTGGGGGTWSHAMRDLQRAIDTQAALGGGDVWVRGGDRDVLDTVPKKRLWLRGKVRLRGGFRGNETRPEQRDPLAARTRIGKRPTAEQAGQLGDPAQNLLRIVGQQDVLLERIHVAGFGYPLHIENSKRVLLREFSIEGYYRTELLRAEVRFEDARFAGGDYSYLDARDTRLAIVDGRFINRAEAYSGLMSERSRVLFERVISDGPVLLRDASKGMFVDSTFRGSAERAGYVLATDAVVVGSQFVNDGIDSLVAAAPLSGESLLVFNASFVRLENGTIGGSYPRAAAIDAPKLEVAASTFFLNRCAPGPYPCNVDVVTAGASPVHNSLFVHPASAGPGEAPDRSVAGTSASRANCVSTRPSDFDAEPNGSGRVLARAAPCANRGDAALLEAARMRMLARAEPFLEAPFEVDLSRYEDADWWRVESNVAGQCRDTDAPEPGRHFALACPP